jgi:hypothetical protein
MGVRHRGLLAGLVLLTIRGPVAWLLAGLLLAADVVVRATVTGLPAAPAWMGVLTVVAFYVDDALVFFGIARLAQIVGEVEDARRQAAGLAVARERLQAARSLQAALGQRLAEVAAKAAATRRALSRDAAQARAHIEAAGAAAREAVARARAVTAGDRGLPGQEPAAPAVAVIGARLAWAVPVAFLFSYSAYELGYVAAARYDPRLLALAVGDIVLVAAVQLYHSGAARRRRRPRAWPVTLALQAVLVYAFLFSFVRAEVGEMAPFLAGSVLLLVPGRWRWAGFAAVVASYSVLSGVLSLRGLLLTASQRIPYALWCRGARGCRAAGVWAVAAGEAGRPAGCAARRAGQGSGRAGAAAGGRDVHDLLELGLSAVALSLIGELTAAKQILTSAGVQVRASIPAGPLPEAADEVLAPVLREGSPTSCVTAPPPHARSRRQPVVVPCGCA